MKTQVSIIAKRAAKKNKVDEELAAKAAKELVVQDNPRYGELFDNIDKLLVTDVHSWAVNDMNGNLTSKDTSQEMFDLIAKAYNICYKDDLTEKDLTMKGENSLHPDATEIGISKFRKHEKTEIGFFKYHYEKGESSRHATISFKPIVEALSVIKTHYNQLRTLDSASKAKIGAELEGISALQYATKHKKVEAIKELIKDGADPKGAKIDAKLVDEALKEAVISEDTKAVDNILKHQSQVKDQLIGANGKTFLSYAITKDKPRIAAYMIRQGFKPQETFLGSLDRVTREYGGLSDEPREVAEKIGGKVFEEYKKLEAMENAKVKVAEKIGHLDLMKEIREINGILPKKNKNSQLQR